MKRAVAKNEISYRNQNEIMRKIFGNEQNYHQVKSLLGKGPYQQDEASLLMSKIATLKGPSDEPKSPISSSTKTESIPVEKP